MHVAVHVSMHRMMHFMVLDYLIVVLGIRGRLVLRFSCSQAEAPRSRDN
jgi:hypothetical protein